MTAFRHLAASVCSALLLFTTANHALAETFQGKCTRVLDGDTIEVLHYNIPVRIRLSGIDAPEKSQAFGMRAKQFAASLAYDQVVTVHWNKKDRYGRTIGEIILPDGRDMNEELVRSGYAWWYRQYAPRSELAQIEQTARLEHKGLWIDNNPIPPWDYRHLAHQPATTARAYVPVARE